MNPIQQAWLKVLRPVSTLINDKLATRGGLVGKFGRFFAIGPRQYGFHPINKLIALMNRMFIVGLGHGLHTHAYIRNYNLGGSIASRPFEFMSLSGKLIYFLMFLLFLIPEDFKHEDGTTLEHLTNKGMPAPYNALNDRVSAHYTEISSLYTNTMSKILMNKHDSLKNKWDRLPEEVKKTKYARPGYKYIQAHSKAIQ